MEWNNSHYDPPNIGQKVYYFGPNIGIGIGHYSYEKNRRIEQVELCPHIFTNINFGTVDACDAPYWLPYDEKSAQGWCPIIPKQYTTGLSDK